MWVRFWLVNAERSTLFGSSMAVWVMDGGRGVLRKSVATLRWRPSVSARAVSPYRQVAIDGDINMALGRNVSMATQQLLVRLPKELARRLKRQVPARRRSAFVQHLLEQALAPEGGEDDPLYQAAMKVEQDDRLMAEMAEWDGTVGDGLEAEAFTAPRG
jgi:hypothetical protein